MGDFIGGFMYHLRAYNENYEITVEQIDDDFPGKWIATLWDKRSELQVDRTVYEYETMAGALQKGFFLLTNITSDIDIEIL